MRNKLLRRVVSYLCVISMILGLTSEWGIVKINADTVTTTIATGDSQRAPLLGEINNADYNFSLNKTASVSKLTTTDGGTDLGIVTSGAFAVTNGKTDIIEIGRGIKEPAWVQVDLGKAYNTDYIDRVAVQYKTASTSPKTKYQIQYSLNGIDYVDVASVEGKTGGANYIYLDKITLTAQQKESAPYARFVRIYSTTDTSAYGLQVKGMAVLTDGIVKVDEVDVQEMESLDEPSDLKVTTSDYGQLEYIFEGALGHDDYVYFAYVDGADQGQVEPNRQYIVSGLAAGKHEVKVMSFKQGIASDGITQSIEVADVKSLFTGDRNISAGKNAVPSSIRENDNPANLTDKNLTSLFRTATTNTSSNIVIDLGEYYKPEVVERVVLLFADNRYAKDYSIDFSLDGVNFITVGQSKENTETLQTATVDILLYELPALRYIRFNLNNPSAANYGFQIYELGVITKEGADLTPVEVSKTDNPSGFDVEVMKYNKIKVKITAGVGQAEAGYKYNVYMNGKPLLEQVDEGEYLLEHIEAGTHDFTVKSLYNSVASDGITVERIVENSYTFTTENYGASSIRAGRILEESFEKEGIQYNNYSYYSGVSANASSTENILLLSENVLDRAAEYTDEPTDENPDPQPYMADKTRWSSVAGEDPQWIEVDLGAEYLINELRIVWQTSSAKDYIVSISEDGKNYTEIAFNGSGSLNGRYDALEFLDQYTARYVRITGLSRNTIYGYSIWGLGIYGPDEQRETIYSVTVDDNNPVYIREGEVFTLGDAEYGYYCDGKMYKPQTEVTVTCDMKFTSVNTLSVLMENGAGIRYIGSAGIRFRSRVISDNETALKDQNVIKEGTLITAQDIYEANGSQLTLTSPGTKVDVKNIGWYNDNPGTYCGSLCNIVESNYIREFTAVAYVTVGYTDGTSKTIYSDKGPVRSISQVATAVKNDGYRDIANEYHSVIDSFIK